jgi:hypothetical protein
MILKGIGVMRGLFVVLFMLAMGIGTVASGKEAPRITKEELKAMLGKPDLIIIDVRTISDWQRSKEKIKGAIRENPEESTKAWAAKYPKDKTIVLYCA